MMISFFFSSLLLSATPVQQSVTIYGLKSGDRLKQECATVATAGNSLSMVLRMSCVAYISGVIDTAENLRSTRGYTKPFCLPRNAVAGQAVSVVSDWLRARRRISVPASEAVIQALRDNYPCD